MVESPVSMAPESFSCACVEDGYFKHPCTLTIDGDNWQFFNWSDSSWFFVGFGLSGHLITISLSQKLRKQKHTLTIRAAVVSCLHWALLLALPHTTIGQHNVRQVYVLKTRGYFCFLQFSSYVKAWRVVDVLCLCLEVAMADNGLFWPEKSCCNPSLYLWWLFPYGGAGVDSGNVMGGLYRWQRKPW
jgi:hypothetical protein